MRLWTVHPRYFDPKGLVAACREALLAQKVLAGATRGYRHHPQLARFQAQADPLATIATFLVGLAGEAQSRGYHFDATKISRRRFTGQIPETNGQLLYEWGHLKAKLTKPVDKESKNEKSNTENFSTLVRSRQRIKLSITTRKGVRFTALASAVLIATAGCNRKNEAGNISPGVAIEQPGMVSLHEETAKAITSAPARVMKAGGLAGALGGARVKMLQAGTREILISMPQLADTQIPVCYSITTTPREAGTGYRLCKREDSNVVVSVQLNGSREQEIQIDWASIILIAHKPVSPNLSRPEPFLQETSCVQSGAKQVTKLADKLWPASGKIDAYATNIQEFIRNMKQENQPRSMDALGILESGANWICTANANLAAALLRSKHIPTRSIAVIPPIAQRLEMHRIVEYFDSGQWLKFDPSALQKDIPMKPWQNIIMAKTTIADEDIAMKPRMGTSLGCPYGQELEFLEGAITFWGKDFFWTIGKALAEFEASDEVLDLAKGEWNSFLESGKLSHGQIKAASATNAAGFLEALRTK